MASETPKKEKKDKKRKSEVADGAVAPEPVPPAEGTASAEAVAMEVDGEKAAKKAKKEKKDKEKRKSVGGVDNAAEEQDVKSEFYVPLDAISPIASPIANRKLSKKLFKSVKRASKVRQLKRGVKEVVKALRKGDKGLLLLASNITPVDVISHLPIMAEEAPGVEYCWVLSKEELGAASGTKRATSCVLISSIQAKRPAPKAGQPAKPGPSEDDIAEWKSTLEESLSEVKKLDHTAAIKY